MSYHHENLRPISVSKKDIGYFFLAPILLGGCLSLLAFAILPNVVGLAFGCLDCNPVPIVPQRFVNLGSTFASGFSIAWNLLTLAQSVSGIALAHYCHKLPASDTKNRIARKGAV
jgi:hypothetical protein